ncbi:conserved hypothetical protein [Nitrosopumilaceae archaeon]|nr:conserved hypothetical protein [Nitrosopumilaceae archaeon]
MVMEIVIPDLVVWSALAFVGGAAGMYLVFRLRPQGRGGAGVDPGQMEYIEREMARMMIRIDAMEIEGMAPEAPPGVPAPVAPAVEPAPEAPRRAAPEPVIVRQSTVESVLQAVTTGTKTSRDIEITLGKSREHTSRLMNNLYRDGLLERNKQSKPYRYSITEKGRARLNAGVLGAVAA